MILSLERPYFYVSVCPEGPFKLVMILHTLFRYHERDEKIFPFKRFYRFLQKAPTFKYID